MTPWLKDTMQIVACQRGFFTAHCAGNELVKSLGALKTAEMLASLLADVPPNRRPQLNLDEEHRPSFATTTKNFYLYLTVDEPELLTWYAVVNNEELFEEKVSFTGRRLPDKLKKIFYL
jgi:hypothetical protein